MGSLKLINAHIIDPVNRVDFMGGLLIEGSTVAAVAPKLEQQADWVIDCQGAYVLPGLVDMHVHLRDPGQTYKEDVYSASRAAAAAGVTALVAMPNTDPAIDSPEILRAILEKAHSACCRVYQAAAITGPALLATAVSNRIPLVTGRNVDGCLVVPGRWEQLWDKLTGLLPG